MWTNASRVAVPYSLSSSDNSYSSYLRIFSVSNHHTGLKELGTIELPETQVRAVQYVPGLENTHPTTLCHYMEDPLRSDLVWVGTDHQT